jgi:heme exporter protein A
LRFWAGLFGGRAEDAMDRMKLTGIADRPAGICSAGQKRRLGLARLALAKRPLWLLDEPTVSLDTDSTALLRGLIREHLDGGGMAVIATHIDLEVEAEELRLEPAVAVVSEDPFLEGSLS